MLDFRKNSARRMGQARYSRRRLLVLILLIGVCVIFMGRGSAVWRCLDLMLASPRGTSSAAGTDDRRNEASQAKSKDTASVHSDSPATGDKRGKPDGPRAMFRALGVEDTYFERLVDGRQVTSDEQEALLRILFRLRMFPAVDLDRWAVDPVQISSLVEHPDHRGMIFRLRGLVTEVEPIEPPEEAAQRYDLPRYFRCRLQLDTGRQEADVYVENVPAAWRKGAGPNAAGGAMAVYLKTAEPTQESPLLVFAARRIAWYPDNLLGKLGMDVGLLDTVEDQTPLDNDREAFYQMLAAVGRAEPGRLLRDAQRDLTSTPEKLRWTNRQGREQYSVVPLFNEPGLQRGRLVELSGVARRVEEIKIDDPDIIARFGFDRYYQVSLVTDDSRGNPLTFCVRELPPKMPYGDLPHYGESIRIAGFFFKTWAYPVLRMADRTAAPGDQKKLRQLSPLLIGRSLEWYPAEKPADNRSSTIVIGGLFILVVIGVWLVAWRSSRREKKWLDKMESPLKLDLDIKLDQSVAENGKLKAEDGKTNTDNQ